LLVKPVSAPPAALTREQALPRYRFFPALVSSILYKP
jgi:hypothetical protein